MHPGADPASADSRAPLRAPPRGPRRREDYVRLVREALAADYAALSTSPLCELPGVVVLARTQYARRIYPAASALRVLLSQAYAAALEEAAAVDDHRVQQVATYLRLARDGMPVTRITEHLGLHSRSYVHRAIQRQAFELVTEAFLQRARRPEESRPAGGAPASSRSASSGRFA